MVAVKIIEYMQEQGQRGPLEGLLSEQVQHPNVVSCSSSFCVLGGGYLGEGPDSHRLAHTTQPSYPDCWGPDAEPHQCDAPNTPIPGAAQLWGALGALRLCAWSLGSNKGASWFNAGPPHSTTGHSAVQYVPKTERDHTHRR